MVLLFVLSVLFLFFVILFYPKSEGKEDLFAQVTLAVLTVMEAHTLWGYITLELLEIGFELDYYARYNFCFAVVILLYWILVKGKSVQRFSAKPHMWITVGLLLAVTVFIGVWRYGPKLNLFAYCSSDSAVHLSDIERLLKYGDIKQLSGRYFLHLNEALFFKCIMQWIRPMNYYQVFLICELCFFFASGSILYALIEKYMKTKFNVGVGIFFIGIYIFGYPLNNLLYGYEYLGASVTIAAHIVYLLEKFEKKQTKRVVDLLAIILACFAMLHCYSLTFLGVAMGIGVWFVVHFVKRPTLIKGAFLIGIAIVMVWKFESIYAYWSAMIEILGRTDATMYRDFWSNSLWVMPLIILGGKKNICNEKTSIAVWMLVGIICMMLFFFVLMWRKDITSYYYYKFYFLLWLFITYSAYIGVIALQNQYGRKIILFYLVAICVVSCVTKNTQNYLDIYYKNADKFWNKIANIDEQKQELFYAAAQKVDETGGVVPYIGTWERHWGEYYYGITNQVSEYINEIYDYPYIMVERNSEAYWQDIGYYSTLEVVYENEYGFIYKTQNVLDTK